MKHKHFLLALSSLQDNMAIAPKPLRASLEALAKEKPKWFANDTEKKAWLDTMVRRIKCMTRDAQQGRIKNANAPWVKHIFGPPALGAANSSETLEEDPETSGEDCDQGHTDTATEAPHELDFIDVTDDRERGESTQQEANAQLEESTLLEVGTQLEATPSILVEADDEKDWKDVCVAIGSEGDETKSSASDDQTHASSSSKNPQDSSCSDGNQYFVHYCTEQRQVYRTKDPGPKGMKEYTSVWEVPRNASDHDAMIAVWPDGFRSEVEDISVRDHATMTTSQKAIREGKFNFKRKWSHAELPAPATPTTKLAPAAPPTHAAPSAAFAPAAPEAPVATRASSAGLWEGKHNDTGSLVTVATRTDALLPNGSRLQIISMCENNSREKSQICQFSLRKVTPDKVEQVKQMMIKLAQDYCKGAVAKENLFDRRDEWASLEGLLTTKVAKKPAAVVTREVSDDDADDDAAGTDDEGSDFDNPSMGMHEFLNTLRRPLAL